MPALTTTHFHCAYLLSACLWLATLLTGAAHATGNAPFTVSLSPSSVPQGGILLVRVNAPGARAVSLSMGKQTVTADKSGEETWEAALGIWMEEPAGTHPVKISVEMADGRRQTTMAACTVTKRTFPIQRLRMSAEQEARYAKPSVQEEYRLIGAGLRHISTRAWRGSFKRPAPGRVSTPYGIRRFRNGKRVGIHKGIDIAAPSGTPITAAAAGTVVLRRKFGLHGNTLVIDHGDGLVGLYIHLRDFSVQEGDRVEAGQLIAHLGATGATTGPNLHYALYVHAIAIDPLLSEKMPEGW